MSEIRDKGNDRRESQQNDELDKYEGNDAPKYRSQIDVWRDQPDLYHLDGKDPVPNGIYIEDCLWRLSRPLKNVSAKNNQDRLPDSDGLCPAAILSFAQSPTERPVARSYFEPSLSFRSRRCGQRI